MLRLEGARKPSSVGRMGGEQASHEITVLRTACLPVCWASAELEVRPQQSVMEQLCFGLQGRARMCAGFVLHLL